MTKHKRIVLKTTLDDHIEVYLSTSTTPSGKPLARHERFTPSYALTYIRLGLGYSAVLIALYTFYLDYILKLDFVDTKTFTTYAVVIYFILNSALTLWIWFGEQSAVFVGSRPSSAPGASQTLKIQSTGPKKKGDPVYALSATWTNSEDAQKVTQCNVLAPFTRFFSADGKCVHAEFEAWLRQEMPLLSTATTVKKESTTTPLKKENMSNGTADAEDVIEVAPNSGHPTPSSVSPMGGRSLSESTELETSTPRKRGRPKKNP